MRAASGCGETPIDGYDGPMDAPPIREARPEDRGTLAQLRHRLWPDSSVDEHAQELARMLAGEAGSTLPSVILVAQKLQGDIVGFVETGLRSHADGCDPSHPVGYVEGWYVVPEWRRKKVGARLLAEAEAWARSHGCREMASDTWVDNVESQRAHEALGFEVVDCCVNYRKRL
jgi:aminoglycoside 6'-N-acetyltransferase I